MIVDKQKLLNLIEEYGDTHFNIGIAQVKDSIENSTLWEEASEAILQQIKEVISNGT